jgi:RHH-type proline utilization regulon transcriptional repressor/proline dehydrogenase/delta 1-pyrroline-5-carboxylate dehydrogenase
MQELRVGNPDRLATDIGPVIDTDAQQGLLAHINKMKSADRKHFSLDVHDIKGTFVAPTMVEIGSLSELTHEVFGPVLHVIRYQRADLPAVIDQINASGYGLTLGIHSRIDETIDFIASRAHVGNIYVNRNIVGAVVGVQPFGGEGKSGTGPKAGGPLYLKRLQKTETPLARHDRMSNPPLDALTVWANQHGYESVAATAEEYMRTSPLGSTIALPGPTGERNTLSFAARGTILCAASSLPVLLNQLAATLATGNQAVVLTDQPALLPDGFPPAVSDRIVQIASLDACHGDYQVALIETSLASTLKPLLAARDGALVTTIDTDAGTAIPLWRLVAERALCINTTAAGGNASLMTLGV